MVGAYMVLTKEQLGPQRCHSSLASLQQWQQGSTVAPFTNMV